MGRISEILDQLRTANATVLPEIAKPEAREQCRVEIAQLVRELAQIVRPDIG